MSSHPMYVWNQTHCMHDTIGTLHDINPLLLTTHHCFYVMAQTRFMTSYVLYMMSPILCVTHDFVHLPANLYSSRTSCSAVLICTISCSSSFCCLNMGASLDILFVPWLFSVHSLPSGSPHIPRFGPWLLSEDSQSNNPCSLPPPNFYSASLAAYQTLSDISTYIWLFL